MKIDKIDSPVYVGRLDEKGVLSIGFDVSDWLTQFPTGTFSVDFKPDYLSESFSLPPTQYRVADGVLTIDIEANITGKAGRASLGIRMLVGDSVDKRSAIIPVVIAESLPPATGEMPEPVQAWIDGAVIVIGQAQTATLNANEATRIANEQELLREGAESDRRRDETARDDAEVIRIAAENTRNDRYETAEDVRDDLYDDAEGARDDLYGLAETARDGLYSSAEGIRRSDYLIAEGERDSLYSTAENNRDGLYNTAENARGGQYTTAENARDSTFGIAESGRASAEISRNSAEGLRKTAETNRIALHNKWSNPEAIATTLAPEASATAEVVIGADKVTLNLGLPEGIQGEQGLSAYEVWEQSNAGKTEAEYIAFLKQEALAAADIANASALAAQNNLLWRRLTTNPASFYPVSQSPLYVRASGEPIQEGIGYPAPDNIRPILPWKAEGETVKITRKSSPADPLLETEITLTAPQDIYGGWLDNEGRGSSNWVNIVLTGTEVWVIGASATTDEYYLILPNVADKTAFSNMLPFKGTSFPRFSNIYGSHLFFYPSLKGETTLAQWKSYVTAKYNAGTPIEVCYQTKVPVPTALMSPPTPLLALPQADRTVPRLNVVVGEGLVRTDYAKSPIQESNEVAQAILNG